MPRGAHYSGLVGVRVRVRVWVTVGVRVRVRVWVPVRVRARVRVRVTVRVRVRVRLRARVRVRLGLGLGPGSRLGLAHTVRPGLGQSSTARQSGVASKESTSSVRLVVSLGVRVRARVR